MFFSIVPITYLICLSIFLTPIASIIIYQIFLFHRENSYIKKYHKKKSISHITFHESYDIANIYIHNQKWHLALMILENDINKDDILNQQWSAKYHNAIGFILQKINYSKLAKQYYLKSSKLDQTYTYARKNLKSLKLSEKS